MMHDALLTIRAAWIGMLAGTIAGAVLGLFFHGEQWMGGYASFRRRMMRLGHIACFGLAFVNFLFGMTCQMLQLNSPLAHWAACAFILGAIAMPTCCFLAAWKKPFRHLFPLPVTSIAAGITLTLILLCRN